MAQQFLALVLAALLCMTVCIADLSWTSCGAPEDTLDLKGLTYQPENPVRGEPLHISALGNLKQGMSQGTKANLVVKWGFVRIPVPPVDICKQLDTLPDTPYKCPVAPGEFAVNQTITLPTEIPDGKYDVTVRINDELSRQVTCLKINLSF